MKRLALIIFRAALIEAATATLTALILKALFGPGEPPPVVAARRRPVGRKLTRKRGA